MTCVPIDLLQKARAIDAAWSPRVVAEVNDYQLKLSRVEGEFVWHDHPETDEAFIVLAGALRLEFRDGAVDLHAGELYVVPHGVEHRPVAEPDTLLLVIEPRGVRNTGRVVTERTAPDDVWA
jgi:mannose-6-phosphate isomerase-like protein (cupin superfamily)